MHVLDTQKVQYGHIYLNDMNRLGEEKLGCLSDNVEKKHIYMCIAFNEVINRGRPIKRWL